MLLECHCLYLFVSIPWYHNAMFLNYPCLVFFFFPSPILSSLCFLSLSWDPRECHWMEQIKKNIKKMKKKWSKENNFLSQVLFLVVECDWELKRLSKAVFFWLFQSIFADKMCSILHIQILKYNCYCLKQKCPGLQTVSATTFP